MFLRQLNAMNEPLRPFGLVSLAACAFVLLSHCSPSSSPTQSATDSSTAASALAKTPLVFDYTSVGEINLSKNDPQSGEHWDIRLRKNWAAAERDLDPEGVPRWD